MRRMAALSGVSVSSRFAATNFSISFTVERIAPAPASASRSQFLTGLSDPSYPGARRFFCASDSVMEVPLMPNGSKIRRRSSSS
jgi:hypothetical protein